MADEKMLTVRDVSIILGVSEKEVVDLAESGAIPAYKVGGVYLRFKKEQVFEFQKTNPVSPKIDRRLEYPLRDKVSDFLYFNDFYILAFLLIALLFIVISRGY